MRERSNANSEDVPLGTCPVCDATIPSTGLLIRYETADGWPRLFAECAECEVPVHPE